MRFTECDHQLRTMALVARDRVDDLGLVRGVLARLAAFSAANQAWSASRRGGVIRASFLPAPGICPNRQPSGPVPNQAQSRVVLARAGCVTISGACTLKLTDEQTEALIRELSQIVDDGDRYPLSPRIVALKEILGQLRPEPARSAPLPPRRHYEPPSKGVVQAVS